MKYKLDTVVPHDGVVHVFHLVREENQGDVLRRGVVSEYAFFVTSRRHGVFAVKHVRYHVVTHRVHVFEAQVGYGQATKRVDADVTGDNLSIIFILEYGVRVLKREEKKSKKLLRGNKYQHDNANVQPNGK